MRWESLFSDLEAQTEQLEIAERSGEVEDRVRAEVGTLAVVDRLCAGIGTSVRLHLLGGVTLVGTLEQVGPDWLLLDEGDSREALIPLTALLGVSGLSRLSAVPGTMGVVAARLRLWFVLRRVARDRLPVRVLLADGSQLGATVDRVGEDFVELAIHAVAEARRRSAVRDMRLVPFAGLVAIRREQ